MIYTLLHVRYMIACDTGGRTSLRSTPPVRSISWCNIYSVVGKQRTSLLPTANTANARGSIALLIMMVYHRVQITEYTPVLIYRQLFFCILHQKT